MFSVQIRNQFGTRINLYKASAGIIIFIIFSGELGPSIFRRNMEGTQVIKEELVGKVFFSSLSRHFHFDAPQFSVAFHTFYLDIECEQKFSLQGKRVDMKIEGTKKHRTCMSVDSQLFLIY